MPSGRSTSGTFTTTALESRKTGQRLSSCAGVFAWQVLFDPRPDAPYPCRRYMQAASQGNAQAQNSLAYCYRYGHGVKVDKTEAVRLYVASPIQDFSLFFELCTRSISHFVDFRRYRLSAAQGNAGAASELLSMGLG
jgi:hypothetical protein